MVILKSEEEIKIMRKAGEIVAMTHEHLKKHLKPGMTTKQIDEMAEKFIREQGAIPSFKGYGGFNGSVCASINEVIIHGIPNKKDVLKEGDIISIDIGAEYQGYHGDSAWTYAIGEVSENARQLMRVTEKALFIGLAQVKPGNRISDISHAIEQYVKSFGYEVPRDFAGHGIGRDLHEDPMIPNFGEKGKGPVIKKGMVLAIEPMVMEGSYLTRTLDDNWTVVTVDGKLSAHYEHTVAVTDDGYEILTKVNKEAENV